MLPRDSLDRAFQQHSMITGQNRVIDVVQVDFELSGGEFRCRCSCRYILGSAHVIQVVEKILDVPEIIRVINLRARLRAADARDE
jgi:hypothetical protein